MHNRSLYNPLDMKEDNTLENPAVSQGSKLLKALGNKKRLEVMYILREGEQKVGDLEKIIGLSQSALSQHLAVLRSAGIVDTRRQAQAIYYSVKNDNAVWLLKMLDDIYN